MKNYLTLTKKDIKFFNDYLLDDTIKHVSIHNSEWDGKTNIKYIMYMYDASYEFAFDMYLVCCRANKLEIDLDWLEDDNGNLIDQTEAE